LKIKISFLFLLLLMICNETWSQISANVTSGCAPLTNVQFSNSYTGASGINWDFGDAASSNLPNPSHTFALPGVYNVVFTATVNGAPVTNNITITVFAEPIVSFVVDGIDGGCAGTIVNFDDTSTGGGGAAITTLQWSFGDGGINSINTGNPSYQYNVAGQFNVGLIVTDANGCVGSLTQNNLVAISDPPSVSISTNPTPPTSCDPPLVVTFSSNATSNSPLGDALTYSWNFGVGPNSTSANPPAVTYTTAGVYNVALTVTDDNDCPRTVTQVVSVTAPVADISALGGENGIVCSDVIFVNNSTGSNPVINYGDGTSGSSLEHTYAAAGNYDVTLTVSSGTCTADTTITITVQIPTVDINISNDTICQFPFNLVVNPIASAPVSDYTWTLPDGTQETGTPLTQEIIYPELEYTINEVIDDAVLQLSIVTTEGCTAQTLDTLFLFKPNALFYPDVVEGCAPLNVIFSDSSTTQGPDIVQWIYHFGDGSPNFTTNNDESVSHTYAAEGIYNPFLVVVTEGGCRDTSWLHTISVGIEPVISFSLSATEVCRGESLEILDTSPATSNLDTWNYSGDNNTLITCQNEPNATVFFDDVTGPTTITMTGGYRGCYSTVTQTINVLGPIGKLRHFCNCETPLVYPFEANVQDATAWTWDFGDGAILSNSTSVAEAHAYAASGDYWAVLTTFNSGNGCAPDVDSLFIRARDLQANFDILDSLCSGVPYVFNGLSSIDVAANETESPPCHNTVFWDFGDDTPPKASAGEYIHAFNSAGSYDVLMTIEDINGCKDTISHHVEVFSIQATISADFEDLCLPLEVDFTSSASATLGVDSYLWNFSGFSTSAEPNPTYVFQSGTLIGNTPQPFSISLQVLDEIGCSAVATTQITPDIPNANFIATTSPTICEGNTVTYDPILPSSGNSFAWTFTNGATSNIYNPIINYAQAGSYSGTLTVTNANGCTNQFTLPNAANVQALPEAGFTSSILEGEVLCYPVQITFTDTSIVNPFGSRTWNLGNGSPTVGNPVIGTNYTQPGDYTITLTTTTSAGCSDTATLDITVEGPVGSFTVAPATICRGGLVNLEVQDTSDVLTWGWDYGDGTSDGALWEINHQYDFSFNPPSNQTVISLVLWNADSICSAVATSPVNFINAEADFLRNDEVAPTDSIHCFGIADVFTNASTNNIDQWLWDFGNGQTFSGANPPPVNFAPGDYTVTLSVVALPEGCVDTIQKNMIIHPLPNPTANGGSICLGESLELIATGGETYSWSPPESLSNPNEAITIAFPELSTTYTVTVTDTNDCVNTATSFVEVFQPVDVFNVDSTLIIGESYEADINLGPGYNFAWEPDIWISCTDCPDAVMQPLQDTTYFLTITDSLGCFEVVWRYDFDVLPLFSIELPDAFSPNGDGVNDFVYVRGWGIEKLISWKIFNRWGELVFETSDINQGWNGQYKGEFQMADTYSYIVEGKPYISDTPVQKSGFINIVK
jgi:gliding motility-associated-like protein